MSRIWKIGVGLVISFIIVVGLNSCTQKKDDRYLNPKYGGTLRINLNGAPDNIFPGQILKNSEQIITTQVYDGLIKYNPRNLEIIPSIAKKWLIEREGTIYTFFLNSAARFHSDKCFNEAKGRIITAADFKYSIEQICRFHIQSSHSLSKQLANLKGFNDFLTAEQQNDTSDISGIVVYNDTTLVFQLNEPDKMFIHFLAGTNGLVFPKEAYEAYGFESTVGSGAFVLKSMKNKAMSVLLTANKNYYQKNTQHENLPFIDSIRFSFITSAQKELSLFKNNSLDLVLSVQEKSITPFLDENIDLFQKNPPVFVMKQTQDYEQNTLYNIMRSNINGLDLNSQGFFDFSTLYFAEPKVQGIKVTN